MTFADPDDVNEGLVFAGRMAEEFKLQTGTFVRAGTLRAEILDVAAPLLDAVVVCGQDEAFVGMFGWLNVPAARQLTGRSDAGLAELASDPDVITAVASRLAIHNRDHPGSSTRIHRFTLIESPLRADRGELTDKGEINPRAVQKERSVQVAALFSDNPPTFVHTVAPHGPAD